LPGQPRAVRGPAAALAAAGTGCAEVLELGGYLLSGVFLDEVRGAGQQNRSVIREYLLEAPARAVPEGEVFHAPDDQGWRLSARIDPADAGALCETIAKEAESWRIAPGPAPLAAARAMFSGWGIAARRPPAIIEPFGSE
jgi:hypothetical protein